MRILLRLMSIYFLFVSWIVTLSSFAETSYKQKDRVINEDSVIYYYKEKYKSGRIFQRENSHLKAMNEFRECIMLDSRNNDLDQQLQIIVSDAMIQLMNTYQNESNPEECVTYFANLAQNPTPFIKKYCMRDLYSVFGYALSRTEKMEDAEKMIEKSLSNTYICPTPQRLFRDYAYAAAIFYSNPAKQDEVIKYSLEAIEQAKLYDNPSGIQWLTSLLGNMYKRTGKIEEATELLLQSVKDSRKLGDLQGESNAYNALTELYLYWELPSYANNYATISLNLNQKGAENPMVTGSSYFLKGKVMYQLGDIDSTLFFLQKADSFSKSLPYNSGTVDIDCLLGKIMVENFTGDSLQEGMNRLKRVTNEATSINRSRAYFDLAKGYIKQNKYSAAEVMLDSMYHQLHLSESPVFIDNANDYALQYYINKGDNAKIRQYAASLLNELKFKHKNQTSRKLAETIVQFQTEKKEQQYRMTQIKLENNKLHMLIYFILSTFVIAFLLSVFFYKRKMYYKKQQLMELRLSKILDNLQKEKENKADIQQQLSEILTEKDTRIEVEAVTPGLLKEKGEPKFRERFEQLYPLFLPKLKECVPNIGHKEELLCMLIILGQDTMQIQTLMGIARSSVNMARYRLRQKMNLDKDINLDDYIKGLLDSK